MLILLTFFVENYISQNLKALRRIFNISQDKLAENINNKRHNIAAWEDGRAHPGITDLLKLSNFFNIDLNILLSEQIDDNYFNRAEEPPPAIPVLDLKTCISMLQYLESELKAKNEIIKSLIDLLKNKE